MALRSARNGKQHNALPYHQLKLGPRFLPAPLRRLNPRLTQREEIINIELFNQKLKHLRKTPVAAATMQHQGHSGLATPHQRRPTSSPAPFQYSLTPPRPSMRHASLQQQQQHAWSRSCRMSSPLSIQAAAATQLATKAAAPAAPKVRADTGVVHFVGHRHHRPHQLMVSSCHHSDAASHAASCRGLLDTALGAKCSTTHTPAQPFHLHYPTLFLPLPVPTLPLHPPCLYLTCPAALSCPSFRHVATG